MLRESLMKPEIVLWSFGLPVVVLLVYISLMGFRSIRRADKPRRMLIWLLPAVVLFMSYYMWGFQVPLVKAVMYVVGGALLCLVVAFLQDALYLSTRRFASGSTGADQTPSEGPQSQITNPDCGQKQSEGEHNGAGVAD